MQVWPAVLHRVVDGRVGRPLEVGVGAARASGPCRPARADTGVSVCAARSITFLPVAVEPVNITKSTWSISSGAHVALARRAPGRRPSGRPHSRSTSRHQQRGERRDLADGLSDHRVARGQRRDAVAEGVGERVVPGADHAHHAHRARSARRTSGPCTKGEPSLDLLVGQVLLRVLGPEAEGGGRVADLGESGRPRRSCRSPRRSCAITRSELSSTHFWARRRTSRAALEAERLPAGLRGAGARHHLRHVLQRDHRGRLATIAPVAGFSTSICVAGGAVVLRVRLAVLTVVSAMLSLSRAMSSCAAGPDARRAGACALARAGACRGAVHLDRVALGGHVALVASPPPRSLRSRAPSSRGSGSATLALEHVGDPLRLALGDRHDRARAAARAR